MRQTLTIAVLTVVLASLPPRRRDSRWVSQEGKSEETDGSKRQRWPAKEVRRHSREGLKVRARERRLGCFADSWRTDEARRAHSDPTVRRILIEHGFEPGPRRADSTWKEFLKRHKETLWACDFLSKNVVTAGGIVTYHVLFFIHVHTGRVQVAGMTPAPNGDRMAQQARNLTMYFDSQGEFKPTIIVRDRDTRFTEQFCTIVENDEIAFELIPPRSPNLNPFAERWVQSVKRECLDHFVVFGEAHLRYLIDSYLAYYNKDRPHQGLGNLRIGATKLAEADEVTAADLVCHQRLSGLLRHYERKAA